MTDSLSEHREAPPVLDALVVADDLTGAADTAVAFARAGLPTQVAFAGVRPGPRGGVLALDTDSRRHTPEAAAAAVTSAVRDAPPARVRMKKIDSTLRGNLRAETAAVLEALGCRFAVCAPAFPGAGRQTHDGVQWAMGARVGDVRDCFAGLEIAHLPLAAVRGRQCAQLLRAAADGARVVVVDAETDADLSALVRAGRAVLHDVLWVGSGGLGTALASAAAPAAHPGGAAAPVGPVRGPALVVVGSAAPVALAQADAVAAAGAVEVSADVDALLAASATAWAPRVAALLAGGRDVVVRIDQGERITPGHGRRVVEALGAALATAIAQAAPAVIVATGGETALAVARALGADGLQVHDELEPGVVRSALAGGTAEIPVVTKAGAFGDPESLVRALALLRTETSNEQGRL